MRSGKDEVARATAVEARKSDARRQGRIGDHSIGYRQVRGSGESVKRSWDQVEVSSRTVQTEIVSICSGNKGVQDSTYLAKLLFVKTKIGSGLSSCERSE